MLCTYSYSRKRVELSSPTTVFVYWVNIGPATRDTFGFYWIWNNYLLFSLIVVINLSNSNSNYGNCKMKMKEYLADARPYHDFPVSSTTTCGDMLASLIYTRMEAMSWLNIGEIVLNWLSSDAERQCGHQVSEVTFTLKRFNHPMGNAMTARPGKHYWIEPTIQPNSTQQTTGSATSANTGRSKLSKNGFKVQKRVSTDTLFNPHRQGRKNCKTEASNFYWNVVNWWNVRRQETQPVFFSTIQWY